MKLLCWNVNSIKTLRTDLKNQFPQSKEPNPFKRLFDHFKVDVAAFQETKLSDFSQVENDMANVPGFESFWSFSSTAKGRNGVVVYARKGSIVDAWEGFEIDVPLAADRKHVPEGRCVTVDLGHFILITCYFPNGGASAEREAYKLEFYRDLAQQCRKLRARGRQVIVCGDVNTAHKDIDLFDPAKFATSTGFLPVEREWIDDFLADGYVDAYRHFYPDKANAYTFWDLRTQKREVNQGWRIDVFYCSNPLLANITSCEHHPEVRGSDHCPVTLQLDLEIKEGLPTPPMAASFRPEFKQKSIASFFKPKAAAGSSSSTSSGSAAPPASSTLPLTEKEKKEPAVSDTKRKAEADTEEPPSKKPHVDDA